MKRKRRNDRENWLGCRMKNIICLRSFHLIFLISRTFSWSADERHLTQENKTNEDGPTSTLRCMPREKRKITCTNISCLRHWLITSATFWSCCPRSSHRSRRTWPKLWDLRDGRLSVFFKLPHVPPQETTLARCRAQQKNFAQRGNAAQPVARPDAQLTENTSSDSSRSRPTLSKMT